MNININRKIDTEMIYVKSMKPHYHSEHLEIILVLQGSLTIHKMERSVTIQKGEFVVVNRHVVHYVESEGAYILSGKIKLSEFKDIFDRIEYVEFSNDSEVDFTKNPLMKNMNVVVVDLLLNIFIYKDKNYMKEELDFYMYQLVYLLFTSYQLISRMKDDNEFINDDLYDRYYYVVEYIFNHIHEKIVSDDVIKHLYMNATYFSQFVKKIGGVGFKELVLYRKLMYITAYLLNPSLSMYEIALKVGITDMKSFYNIFKKFYKVSPAKWKNKILLLKDNYVICEDDYILKNFIEENRIHKHRENTVSKLFKYLIIDQSAHADYQGAVVTLNPYQDMGNTIDNDYQVYKFFPSLTKRLKLMNLSLCLQYPYQFLQDKKQFDLMIHFLKFSIIQGGMNDVKKWQIEILANDLQSLKKADDIKNNIINEMDFLNIRVVLEVIKS